MKNLDEHIDEKSIRTAIDVLRKLAVGTSARTAIGMKLIEHLQTNEGSLRVLWWHILLEYDPELTLPVNHKIPNWRDVQVSLAWSCSENRNKKMIH